MIRLTYIAILALALSAYSCDGPEIEKKIALFTGDSAPFTLVATTEGVEEEALEEVVEPVLVEPPEPPRCDDYLNRGVWYDCHGNWLRDL